MPKSRWLGSIMIGILVVTLGTTPVSGQGQSPAEAEQSQMIEEIELTRAVIQAERQAIVTRAMDLTPEEAQAFWPLYREYRLEMTKVGDRLFRVITTYAENYRSLSDELAKSLLTDYLSIEKARLGVKSQYLPRFQKVLPPKKVARYYQVENKLDIIIQAELAQEIPLVR